MVTERGMEICFVSCLKDVDVLVFHLGPNEIMLLEEDGVAERGE